MFNTARKRVGVRDSLEILIQQFNIGSSIARGDEWLASFCPTSDENESSTEFQNDAWNLLPNAPKNLAENRAVYITNSAL